MTYWDIMDRAWLDAPAGMVRRDSSPKPSYDAMHALIEGEWWLAPTKMATDAEGRFRFDGFLGGYEVSVGDRKAAFQLDRTGGAEVGVRLPE
jgi:endo-1,4-beta-xylanase